MTEGIGRHTFIERVLHNLAFSAWFPHVHLSNIESTLYHNQLSNISIDRPVFITALPRAGTTLLLELCVNTNEFVSHRYRDMPFLLTPLLGHHLTKNFREQGALSERIHGDGILVNYDSPEAFEEIIWKQFWPSYYQKDRILLWTKQKFPAFQDFFLNHMRKMILLRGRDIKSTRYLSKNNLNIARVKYLSSVFPDSVILILFRSPLQQAASLLKQHGKFQRIHERDGFAQKYMQDTGHFDFGKNLRPVDFDGWLSKDKLSDPNTLSFWLEYWINTYRYLIDVKTERVRFFSYDSFCENPIRGLENLGRILGLDDCRELTSHVDRVKKADPHPIEPDAFNSTMIDRAQALYLELHKNAEEDINRYIKV